jgi:hypothetical protein
MASFPILNQANAISVDARRADSSYQEIGTITWHIRPVTRTIAGWQWEGIALHYDVALKDGYQTNVFRQATTWEIGGAAVGNGIAALRYRGLGSAEEIFAEAETGGIRQAFSTTEVIAGHVGTAPLVSPVVPVSMELNDRGFALRHRVGAWIARMARGAGANFVDWIWKDGTIMASYRERQGNFRAVSEAFPGDTHISFTDEEYFPVGQHFSTEPQLFLTLQQEEAWPLHEVRTRWQEVDEYVRNMLADELGFQRHRALPGVGLLTDYSWDKVLNGIASHSAKAWADHGAKVMAYHNPGWINGRYQGTDGPEDTGGGVCDIYDWVPAKDLEQPWIDAYQSMQANEITYLPWIGQTVWHDQPFVTRLGSDKKEIWALNGPYDDYAPGYGRTAKKGNIYNQAFRDEFTRTLQFSRDSFGFDGYWIDSFQNLMMSQLSWGDGTGTSMQRGWWEWLAERSREGLTVMAESNAYPGLSCSIESAVLTKEASPYYMKEVWRWIRGTEFSHHEPAVWNELDFKIMANRGWLAPDVSRNRGDMRIPTFKRYATTYNAVRDDMDRSFVLSDGRGVLWLTDATADQGETAQGVLFVFTEHELPSGIIAKELTDNAPASALQALRAYRIEGKHLRASYDMMIP